MSEETNQIKTTDVEKVVTTPSVPPNFTLTPEEAKAQADEKDKKEKKEKKAKTEKVEEIEDGIISKIKSPQTLTIISSAIILVVLLIISLSSCFSIKSIKKDQNFFGEQFKKYLEADQIISQEVLNSKEKIINLENTFGSFEERIAALENRNKIIEATVSQLAAVPSAVAKMNQLAVMNRNRIYQMLIESGKPVPHAFTEDKMSAEDVQALNNSLLLSLSKTVEEEVNKMIEEEKLAKKLADEKSKKEAEAKIVKPIVPDPSATTKQPKKRDYLLFLKPWKWF